ncbi:hypothetical protein [Pseudonocardia alni]|uniref:hypothetical protein n=1 Tax=Pseudonocardia alni TaxID=33907 RepID=UPI0033164EA5
MRKLQKAAAAGAMAIGLVGVGIGSASAGTPSPAPVPVTQQAPHVRQGATSVTVTGTVLRADGRTVQVRDRAGRVTVVQVNQRTTVTKRGRTARLSDLVAQDRVTVTAQRSAGVLTATRIVDTGR